MTASCLGRNALRGDVLRHQGEHIGNLDGFRVSVANTVGESQEHITLLARLHLTTMGEGFREARLFGLGKRTGDFADTGYDDTFHIFHLPRKVLHSV